jgi:ABC-type microcin C transport system permease subunit YejE
MIKLNPQTRKKLARFQKIKLGYFSFITLSLIIAFLSVAE